MDDNDKFKIERYTDIKISNEFFVHTPSFGISMPDGKIFLLKAPEANEYYLLLYPDGYPQEIFDLVNSDMDVAVVPEAYVRLSSDELSVLTCLFEKDRIETTRDNLEQGFNS